MWRLDAPTEDVEEVSGMGWLEDLAKAKGLRSLRALAVEMEASPLWPKGEGRSVETVANKLRDADKGKDAAWWTGTGRDLLPALAALLEETVDVLSERLQRESGGPDDSRAAMWTFTMFPALRPLDLRVEAPFPGIPPTLGHRGGPREEQVWWYAKPGAGKTLVGRWLELRFGWVFIHGVPLREVQWPQSGNVFVELPADEPVQLVDLETVPDNLKVIIAAAVRLPACPPNPSSGDVGPGSQPGVGPDSTSAALESNANSEDADHKDSDGVGTAVFTELSSAPVFDWALELIDWAAARVRSGGGFVRDTLRELLGNLDSLSAFETPGDLLSFLGLIDEVGIDSLLAGSESRPNPLRWLTIWMQRAIQRVPRAELRRVVEILERSGPATLIAIEAERLRRGWRSPMPDTKWAELASGHREQNLEPSAILRLLEEVGPEAVKDLLAASGPVTVAGLRKIGALTEAAPDALEISPRWVENIVHEEAFTRVYAERPRGLGALLLFEETSDVAMRRLINDLESGQSDGLAACVEMAPATPEDMAALNGAFRAIGMTLACGSRVPLDLVASAWQQQISYAVPRFSNWVPMPVQLVWAGEGRRGPTAVEAWLLAAFAIARTLHEQGSSVIPTSLNPWGSAPLDSTEWDRCINAISTISIPFLDDPETEDVDPMRMAPYRIGADLFDTHGVIKHQNQILMIQEPDLLACLVRGDSLDLESSQLDGLAHLAFGLDVLDDACARRGVDADAAIRWCWQRWGTGEGYWPSISWLPGQRSRRPGAWAERLWRQAPAEVLADRFYETFLHHTEVWPWANLATWEWWLRLWSRRPTRWSESAAVFEHVPEEVAVRALVEGHVDEYCHDVRRVLWARMPERLIAIVDQLAGQVGGTDGALSTGQKVLMGLVRTAPPEQCERLVERAGRWFADQTAFPGVAANLQWWLYEVVERRVPGWRRAYSMLMSAFIPK
jgi:hypothetical protein